LVQHTQWNKSSIRPRSGKSLAWAISLQLTWPTCQLGCSIPGFVLTTRNSFLSTRWFPSVSNMLKAIRNPVCGSENVNLYYTCPSSLSCWAHFSKNIIYFTNFMVTCEFNLLKLKNGYPEVSKNGRTNLLSLIESHTKSTQSRRGQFQGYIYIYIYIYCS
jgi:hypothetical protein